MKIKVTFEKIYDSDKFYIDFTEEDMKGLTFREFQDGILMDIQDYPDEIIDDLIFEEIEE